MRNSFRFMPRRSSLTAVLLASLALLPIRAWAARDEEKADRAKDKQQTQVQPAARGRQAVEQRPVPGAMTGPQRTPNGVVSAAPAPAVRPGQSDVRRPAAFPNTRPSAPADRQVRAPEPQRVDRSGNLWQQRSQPAPAERRVRAPEPQRVERNGNLWRQEAQPAPASRPDRVTRAPEKAEAQPDRLYRANPVTPRPEHKVITVRPAQERENAPVVRPAPVARREVAPNVVIKRAPAPERSRASMLIAPGYSQPSFCR